MRKKVLLILLMFVVTACACAFTACSDPAQLVMSELSYNETTKIVSWDKVANATGYSLRINDDAPVTEFTENGNKMQYVLDQNATGTYTIYVKAIGDGEKFLNSVEKSVEAKFLLPLVMSELSYNPTTRIVSWDEVDNAAGYYLRVGDEAPVNTFTRNGNRVEYFLNRTTPGSYTVYVKAVAYVGEHSDSAEKSVWASYNINLTLGELSYEPTTKVISWDILTGATSYALRVGNGATVTNFTQNGNKMEYVLDQATPGSYDIYIKAIGGGGWIDSAEKKLTVDDYRLLITMGDVTYDPVTKTVSWDKIDTADGYSLRIDNGNPITEGFIEDGNKIIFEIPSYVPPGAYNIFVTAIGNATYGDSAAKSVAIDYLLKLATPEAGIFLTKVSWTAVTYANRYVIQIDDGEEVSVGSKVLSYVLSSLIEYKVYNVKIKAVGNEYCGDSDWAIVTYKPNHTTVAGGLGFSVAIGEDGGLYTWGANSSNGQLGNGTTSGNVTTPTSIMEVNTGAGKALAEGTKFAMVSVSNEENFALALDTQGNLYAWGGNGYGQLGLGDSDNRSLLTQIKKGTKFVTASAGFRRAAAIDTNGDIWVWGWTNSGFYGLGDSSTPADSNVPIKLNIPGEKFAIIHAGYQNYMAVTVDGQLYAWGYGYYGALGSGSTSDLNLPTKITTSKRVVSVTSAYGDGYCDSSLILDEDGAIWTAGCNNSGALGNGTGSSSSWTSVLTFTKITPTASGKSNVKIVSVAGGDRCYITIDSEGDIWSWGYNTNNKLGNGNTTLQNKPVLVTVTDIDFIKVGRQGQAHSFAVSTDGTLYTWGNPANGRLGNGTTSGAVTTPKAISFKTLDATLVEAPIVE